MDMHNTQCRINHEDRQGAQASSSVPRHYLLCIADCRPVARFNCHNRLTGLNFARSVHLKKRLKLRIEEKLVLVLILHTKECMGVVN